MGKSNDKNFEFEIGGHILRGDLKSHMTLFSIGSETNLEITYAFDIGCPNLDSSYEA